MGEVIKLPTTKACGLDKEDFKAVYYYMMPNATEAQLEKDWETYSGARAEFIRGLNNG